MNREMKQHALVIEDDSAIWSLYTHAFSKFNIQTFCVENLKKAYNFIRNEVPDIVVLDLSLPDGNGIQLLKTIRSTPRLRKISVVITTSNSRQDIVVQAAQLHVQDYLLKPINFERFYEVINTALLHQAQEVSFESNALVARTSLQAQWTNFFQGDLEIQAPLRIASDSNLYFFDPRIGEQELILRAKDVDPYQNKPSLWRLSIIGTSIEILQKLNDLSRSPIQK